MRPQAIFVPMSLLALWTFVVLFLVGARRLRATRAGQVPHGTFRAGPGVDVPLAVTIANRHFMNLLEAPVLFYVVCIALFVSGGSTATTLALAWAYLVLRLVHSFIHLGYNRVIHRLFVFALGNLVLLGMWVMMIVQVV
jgi:hypothetical protein